MDSPGRIEEPEQAFVGEEISLGQHVYNMSPKRKKFRTGDDGGDGKGGMRKYYLICALVWLVVIGVVAYLVPTYLVDQEGKFASLLKFCFESQTFI